MRARTVLVFVLSLAPRAPQRVDGLDRRGPPPLPAVERAAPPVREAQLEATDAGVASPAPASPPLS